MQAPTTADAKTKAVKVLQDLHSRGELKPVHGWNPQYGSALDAYMDILGLNNDDSGFRATEFISGRRM